MHGGLVSLVDELIPHHKPDPLHTILARVPNRSHVDYSIVLLCVSTPNETFHKSFLSFPARTE